MQNVSIINTPIMQRKYGGAVPKRQQQLTQSQTIIILEKLQSSLELDNLLTSFAAIAAQYVRFSGLNFRGNNAQRRLVNNGLAIFQQDFTLSHHGRELGCLQYSAEQPFQLSELGMLKQLHGLLQTNLMHALMFQEMQQRILKDHLTGLDNRASFDENIHRSYSLCQRHKSNMVLLLTDLNNFKHINDSYGHQFGDKVLQHFAKLLQRCVRSSDLAFRLGGDEFAVILQPASEQSTRLVIERIYNEMASDALLTEFNISSAIGSAIWRSGVTVDSLFKQADDDLYAGKFN